MNDCMTTLHQRFFREPNFSGLEDEIKQTRLEVRDCLNKMQRRRLMHRWTLKTCCRRKPLLPALLQASNWHGALPRNWRRMACTPSKRKKSSEPVQL